jgi:hypothetical protein
VTSILIQTNIVILMGFLYFFQRFGFFEMAFIYWLIDFYKCFRGLTLYKKTEIFVYFDYLRCVALVISDTPHVIQSRVVIY